MNRTTLILWGIIIFGITTYSQPTCDLPSFNSFTLDPVAMLNGTGDNVDSIEFWKAPDSTETLMFVTSKDDNLVEVWKYPFIGNELTPITHSTFNNSQVNGVVVDQDADLLYVATGEPSSTVSVFSLPDMNFQFNFNKSGADYQSEPNLALMNLDDGTKRIYVSADNIVYVHNAVNGDYISEFTPEKGLETMVADSFYQRLYIPDENSRTGVYIYDVDGNLINDPNNPFGTNAFDNDAEGILIHSCPLLGNDTGHGSIVVSDQRGSLTDFEVFDRITKESLGNFRLTNVNNTDGIGSYPYALPDYPLGIFAAIDDDNSVAIIGWDEILNEILSLTGTETGEQTPNSYKLNQNYPNPFNPTTKISFTIPDTELVSLVVYDLLGEKVTELVSQELPAGFHEVEFSADELNSGIYFYEMKAGNFEATRKMIFLK